MEHFEHGFETNKKIMKMNDHIFKEQEVKKNN